MAQWKQRSPHLLAYCADDPALIYGYVVRQGRDDAPGRRWEARVASPTGQRDRRLQAGVSLREAQTAVERSARAEASARP